MPTSSSSSSPPSPQSRIPRRVASISHPLPETSEIKRSPFVLPSPHPSFSPSPPSPSPSHPSRCYPRPKLALLPRPPSHTYTSFSFRPPMTPSEEAAEGGGGGWGWRGWLKGDLETGNGERERLLPPLREERGEGLPKVSRVCLVAEVKCYGFYMIPPLLVFLGLMGGLVFVFGRRS